MADLPFAPEPGSISPTVALEPTEVFSRPVGFDDDPNLISPGLRPIDPNAREKLNAQDPLAEFKRVPDSFEDAGGAKKIDLNARAKLGGFDDPLSEFKRVADPLSEFKRVSDFNVRSVEELDKDRKGFDPVSYFAQNPNVSDNPADFKKLLEVARRRYEEGKTAKGLAEAVFSKESGKLLGEVVSTAPMTLVEKGIDVIVQPTANVILGALSGDLFNKQRRDALFNETRRIVKKSSAEGAAGAESATVGLADLGRTLERALPKSEVAFPGRFSPPGVTQRAAPKPLTDQEVLRQLSDDASFRQNAEDILVGQGETAKNLGLDKETMAKQGIELDHEAIRLLSLVDPVTMIATGGAFKLVGLGGKVLGTAKTLAGAKYATEKLAEIAKLSAGKAIQGTGKLIGGTGTLLKGTGSGAATIAGISSAISGGGIPQSLIIGGAVKAIGPGLRKLGPVVEHAGKAIAGGAGAPPVSANLQRLLDIVAVPTKVATTIGGGAVKGLVAAAPFAIAAQTDEQAGALLAAGGGIGAGAGVGAGAFRVVKNSAARRYFDQNRPVLEDVSSPGYGRLPDLDALNEKQMQKLSAQDASEVNNFREILRPHGGEFYNVDQPVFRQKVADEYRARTGKELTTEQLDLFQKHHALFDETTADGKKIVYLNGDATGLKHDAGHIFDSLLSKETVDKLNAAIDEAFPKEKIEAFRKLYSDWVGFEISPEAAKAEFRAEQFAALFNNVPVTELNAPKSLLSKFIDIAAEGAEILGVDIGAGRTTPNLNAPVSVGIRKLFLNAAGEVTRRNVDALPEGPAPTNVTPLPPTPPPAPAGPGPVAPPTNIVPLVPPPANVVPLPTATPPAPTAPAGRSIRVTPEQVAAFKQRATPEIRAAAAARAAETGVDYARGEAKKADGSSTSVIIERISDSMESGAPVVGIEHLGITSVGTPEGPIGATLRKAEQAGGYAALNAAQLDVRQNAPPEIVAQHSKNFVPVRWTDQGGSPTLIAMSLDKVISNILRIAADKTVQDIIPYSVENGKLTPDGWREVVADAQAYSENQANGRKGDGGRLEVPEVGLSIPAENPAYTPQPLTPERANFQNLVQGLAPPQTSRSPKGEIPGNIKGQLLAEANKRPVEIPANIPTKQAGKQAFVDFPPRVIQETNPLRNEMARRGVRVRDLLEVTERIRAKDIVSATPRPEINYKAPVTDVIRGGFLPAPTEFRQKNLGGRTVEEFSDYVLKSSPTEWKAATDNMTGGLTGGAWNLGLGLKDAGDVAVLKSYADKFSDSAKSAMKAGDFDGAMSQVTRGQFFREAYEAATGTGSAGAAFKRGAAGMESAKPPFPIEATTESTTAGGKGTTEAAKFQPRAEKSILTLDVEKTPSKGLWRETFLALADFFDHGGHLDMFASEVAEKLLRAVGAPFNEYDAFIKQKAIQDFEYARANRRDELVENPTTGKLESPEAQFRRIYDQLTRELNTAVAPRFKTPPSFEKRQAEALKRLEKEISPEEERIRFLEAGKGTTPARPESPEGTKFLPAEELEVGTVADPELRIVPTPASAGGTPPVEPPGIGLIPPPVAAGAFQPAPSLNELKEKRRKKYQEHHAIREDKAVERNKVTKEINALTKEIENIESGFSVGSSFSRDMFSSGVEFTRTPTPQTSFVAPDGQAAIVWRGGLHGDAIKEGEINASVKEPVSDFLKKTGAVRIRVSEDGSVGRYPTDLNIEAPSGFTGSQISYIQNILSERLFDSEGGSEVAAFEKVYVDGPNGSGAFSFPEDRRILNKFLLENKSRTSETGVPRDFTDEDEGRFQPRTEAGRKLEERGYEIVASGEMGTRRVTILDRDKETIAQIQSVQRSPQKAEISFVSKKKGAPSGLGDILYREVGSRLRDDGVRSLGGQVISPEPLAIRKKIFGGFEKITVNEEPATYKEALDMAERLGNSDELMMIEPVNKITAATRFLPEDQQDMGFIRQGDAAIKVRDIERERNRVISELGSVQDKDRDALVERLAQVSRDAEGAWSDFTQSRAGAFQPREPKRDAQDRPLTKSGEVDMKKWMAEGEAARKKHEAEPIKEYVPSGPIVKESDTPSTGWILPDKKFVPLQAAFHELFLAENAKDLNKKYGTKFSEIPSTDDRLSAVNAGFVRFRNYNARLSVEANAAKWLSLKSKVLETLQDREGSFDSLSISLLNTKGQEVDSTSAVRLHEMTGPEKLDAIEDAVGSLRVPSQ